MLATPSPRRCPTLKALGPIRPGERGVEIGAGTGRFSTPFGITEGVEPAAAMRRIARAKGIHARNAVAEALPYPDSAFAFAVMVTTICFVADPPAACREARRVLAPGGRFVVGLVDRASPLGRHYEKRREASPFYREARFFTVTEVVALLDRAGFRDFRYWQTLFRPLSARTTIEPVLSGHGRGGFAAISAAKPAEAGP